MVNAKAAKEFMTPLMTLKETETLIDTAIRTAVAKDTTVITVTCVPVKVLSKLIPKLVTLGYDVEDKTNPLYSDHDSRCARLVIKW